MIKFLIFKKMKRNTNSTLKITNGTSVKQLVQKMGYGNLICSSHKRAQRNGCGVYLVMPNDTDIYPVQIYKGEDGKVYTCRYNCLLYTPGDEGEETVRDYIHDFIKEFLAQ